MTRIAIIAFQYGSLSQWCLYSRLHKVPSNKAAWSLMWFLSHLFSFHIFSCAEITSIKSYIRYLLAYSGIVLFERKEPHINIRIIYMYKREILFIYHEDSLFVRDVWVVDILRHTVRKIWFPTKHSNKYTILTA